MARIFPLKISAADVATMLAALDGKTPYLSQEGALACFDFDGPLPNVCVAVKNGEYGETARRAIEEALALLPQFHARVSELHSPDGPNDGSEDHDLGAMDIGEDEVYLDYCARSYNSTWGHSFHKDCNGRWHPGGIVPPSVELLPEWRSKTAVMLAQQMYGSRDFTAMPILADALEDAGCENRHILDHCRGSDPHVRSCWVLTLMLAKE
jgi:hypothetical protein